MRLHRIVPVFGILLLISLCCGVGFLVGLEYWKKPEGNLMPVVGTIAAFVALVGWMVQSYIALRNSRRQHTMTVLFQSRMNAEYRSQIKLINQAYPGEGGFTYFPPGTSPVPDVDQAILFMLNYYEFIGVGIWHGDLDVNIMRDCIRSQFIGFTNKAHDIIEGRRKLAAKGRPLNKVLAFRTILWLRAKWMAGYYRANGLKPGTRPTPAYPRLNGAGSAQSPIDPAPIAPATPAASVPAP